MSRKGKEVAVKERFVKVFGVPQDLDLGYRNVLLIRPSVNPGYARTLRKGMRNISISLSGKDEPNGRDKMYDLLRITNGSKLPEVVFCVSTTLTAGQRKGLLDDALKLIIERRAPTVLRSTVMSCVDGYPSESDFLAKVDEAISGPIMLPESLKDAVPYVARFMNAADRKAFEAGVKDIQSRGTIADAKVLEKLNQMFQGDVQCTERELVIPLSAWEPQQDIMLAESFLETACACISGKSGAASAEEGPDYSALIADVQSTHDSASIFAKKGPLETCKLVRHALMVVGQGEVGKTITSVRSLGKKGSAGVGWEPKGTFAMRLGLRGKYCPDLIAGVSSKDRVSQSGSTQKGVFAEPKPGEKTDEWYRQEMEGKGGNYEL